jgi:ADP-ribosylglycohydrolase
LDEKVIDRIRGTILGSACANSLGGSCIGLNRKEIVASTGKGVLRDFSPGLPRSFLPDHQPGQVLADTIMSARLAESLIASGGDLDEEDLKRRLTALLEDDRFLKGAPGSACLSGLRRMADGLEPVADGSAESTHDSGAARAFVIGALPDRVNVVETAIKQAKLTQGDSRVWAGAAVLAESVSHFIRGERIDDPDRLRSYVHREFEVAARIDPRFAEAWDDVAPDLDYTRPATEVPYSLLNVQAHVNEALPSAVGIFLIFRHSYEDAACAASTSGGDTDTVAAVVGALAGAYHGASAIPAHWLERLSYREHLEKIADDLARLW